MATENEQEKRKIELQESVDFIVEKQPHKVNKALFFLKRLVQNRTKDVGSVTSSNKMIQEIQQNLIPVDKVLTQLMRKMGEKEATEVMQEFSKMSKEVNRQLEDFIALAIEKNMIDQKSKEKFQKKKAVK